MKKTLTAIMTVLVCIVSVSAMAGKAEKGHQLYVDHQFDQAIEMCKGEKDIMSKMVLALSYTERYKIYKNKLDRDQAKMYIKLLEVEVGMDHADILEKFVGVPGNPNGNDEALDLLEQAFDNSMATKEDILKMAEFIDPAKGDDVNKEALGSIKKHLDNVRDYVSDGGTMPIEMQKLFQNPALLNPLVNALERKKTSSYAEKCLVYIEEPALAILEAKDLTPNISDAIVAIKKAQAKRLKKFPQGTWYSASGK